MCVGGGAEWRWMESGAEMRDGGQYEVGGGGGAESVCVGVVLGCVIGVV